MSTTEVKPCSSKKARSEGRDEGDPDQGEGVAAGSEQSEGLIQDQIIIAPEIMRIILGYLDFRSLKQVRQVCKSWLLEAQAHLEQRGTTVHMFIERSWTNTRLSKFKKLCKKKIPALPQPFESIDVVLSERLSRNLILELMSLISLPLKITSISAGKASLKYSLPLIIHCSFCVEYIELSAQSCEVLHEPPLDPKQSFPELRRLNVDVSPVKNRWYSWDDNYLPAVVAWITKASPKLETYESRSKNNRRMGELASELVLKMNIGNVKTLILVDYNLNSAALHHFMSLPFTKLQSLKLSVYSGNDNEYSYPAVAETVKKAANTLRVLDLSNLRMENLGILEVYGLPICSKVQELTIASFPYRSDFVSNRFPSLQCLNVRNFELENDWGDYAPLLSLKTLRLKVLGKYTDDDYDSEEKEPEIFQFFENLIGLERINLSYSLLMRVCAPKEDDGSETDSEDELEEEGAAASSDPDYSKLLEGVKYLELNGNDFQLFYGTNVREAYSSLGVFKGLETITVMESTHAIPSIPVSELPCLKVIQFPWGGCSDLKALLKMAKGVGKVIITNCCSISRTGVPYDTNQLNAFFAESPNAECGCKKGKENMLPSNWNQAQEDLSDEEEMEEELDKHERRYRDYWEEKRREEEEEEAEEEEDEDEYYVGYKVEKDDDGDEDEEDADEDEDDDAEDDESEEEV